MADVAESTFSAIAHQRRWDSSYLLLAKEHGPVVNELMQLLTDEELRQLAKDLPYNDKAANAVCPRLERFSGPAEFAKWVDGPKTLPQYVAVYLAAACQAAHRIFLEEILALKKEMLGKIQRWTSVLAVLKEKKAVLTVEAIKRQN